MISPGIQSFSGKRVLLLQGPIGPFFRLLAKDLKAVGAKVFKINFNAGDWLFYPTDALNYRGTMDDWPLWFEDLVLRLKIDTVLLFGDCRPIHRAAHAIATKLELDVGVFEEGYIRPDYITLERSGVNGHSKIPRHPELFKKVTAPVAQTHPIPKTYNLMVWYGFCYFTIGSFGAPWFIHYKHHRPLTILEALPWLRSAWRKLKYKWLERGQQDDLVQNWSNHFFLVPLQVFNDSQITVHADCINIRHFIKQTLNSFAAHAPADTLLVFKHHPMDRGYCNYRTLIKRLADRAGVSDRVRYIHDQHLPTLLDHARGVVVVNSTVGFSALYHGTPTKTCGRAFYNMEGLTYQGSLDDFWQQTENIHLDKLLYKNVRNYVITRTQLNGSFYKKIKNAGFHSGVIFPNSPKTRP
ncbi:capsule biosynthesis protein [Gynuella sunshinyii]|uniref:Capsule polysaccharide export protein n=1 Tax=Gynuella sunshinyii YC6258 TaxID=1445510 RepID=A0A0C5VU36_9GAMM|nr:capsular biosynthesis protein [Gynuella sunshinyii]AJQ93889.1 capsule polysaccharide export protein [Gynuella sunshinyii YC6258]